MKKLLLYVVLASALSLATSASAAAGDLKLTIGNGRVTLIAQDVPLRQILAEWGRVGDTRFVNAEKLVGPPLTLQLVDVPEKQALDILLHTASGFMVAPRAAGATGASVYDKVMILATSRAPVGSASTTPAPFTRPMVQSPPPPPAVEDDDGEPAEQPVPPPGMTPAGMAQPGMMPPTAPGAQPQAFPAGAQQPGQQPQVPMTAPRPGMLPTPPPGTPGNPYQPFPQPNQQNPQQVPPRRPGGGGQ